MVQWWAMKSQPGFNLESTTVYLSFWQPSPWATCKIFIGLFVWYRLDPQQLESAAVISHSFSETQVLIYPSWGSGSWYEGDHTVWKAASLESKAAGPLSLPSGSAAWGADALREARKERLHQAATWLCNTAPHLAGEIKPCMQSFCTLKHHSAHWIMLRAFLHYSIQCI